jgi:hypothetical protein
VNHLAYDLSVALGVNPHLQVSQSMLNFLVWRHLTTTLDLNFSIGSLLKLPGLIRCLLAPQNFNSTQAIFGCFIFKSCKHVIAAWMAMPVRAMLIVISLLDYYYTIIVIRK